VEICNVPNALPGAGLSHESTLSNAPLRLGIWEPATWHVICKPGTLPHKRRVPTQYSIRLTVPAHFGDLFLCKIRANPQDSLSKFRSARSPRVSVSHAWIPNAEASSSLCGIPMSFTCFLVQSPLPHDQPSQPDIGWYRV
jgi:hypothetical protein